MASTLTLAENFKIVQLAVPAAANAMTYDYVCCKNVHKVWIIVEHYSAGGDTDLVLILKEATDVAAGTNATVTNTAEIWVNADTSATDTLVKQTAATGYTIDTGAAKPQQVVFEWDCAKFAAGYDCLGLVDTGGNAANIASATAILQERYPQATPPTAITD